MCYSLSPNTSDRLAGWLRRSVRKSLADTERTSSGEEEDFGAETNAESQVRGDVDVQRADKPSPTHQPAGTSDGLRSRRMQRRNRSVIFFCVLCLTLPSHRHRTSVFFGVLQSIFLLNVRYIFTILSPVEFIRTLLHSGMHITPIMSLHYFVKNINIQKRTLSTGGQ